MSTTKDTENTTSTYVRSSDADKDKTTGKKDTTSTNKDTTSSSTHQDDTTSYASYNRGTTGTTGTSTQNQQHGRYGQDYDTSSSTQQYRGTAGTAGAMNQQEVQSKLREVGNLLQRAGQLLQDLQVSAGGQGSDYQSYGQQYTGRSQGGNYSGPYGGFESHSQQYRQLHGGNQFGDEYSGRYGQQQQFGGRSERDTDRDREYNRGRFEDRDRFGGNRDVDRFGGFGGPNRPDLAYGGRYERGETFVRDSDRDRRNWM
ncbi:uncharacterized protein LOC129581106 [Paramacrobiotus metropolitanus]|uniref:uncharacterized protein LOC129581106 n=1 Tax=Paramacrobiotus metropolitanus TaxID=2943436 RepID=UPI002446347E|nr:uncharacterized protein LOC129581106 [Paramacrobiotus metropolitanus]